MSINFIDKIRSSDEKSRSKSYNTPLKERISNELYDTFDCMNFSGVFRIGEWGTRNYFISSGLNVTQKVTQQLNLLLNNNHFNSKLQNWFNTNGIDKIDISLIKRTKDSSIELKKKEEYYINLYKPKFNKLITIKEQETEVNPHIKRHLVYIYNFVTDEYRKIDMEIEEYKRQMPVFVKNFKL